MSVFITRCEPGPGSGPRLAVKDNIDVAGVPTTAGCPGFAYVPSVDATCVARLRRWGARIVGKTNLDQFATGLVGTRSPYGTPPHPQDPALVPGGSSSGSAVAVATGAADLALGTDTAGSGRIPAAFCGIVGLKPTRGWVPTRGVVPACRSLDCVSVFAPGVAAAWAALLAIAGDDPDDAWARPRPRLAEDDAPLTIAVPRLGDLDGCDPAWIAGWRRARERLADAGHRLHEIDLGPFAATARLLYEGAFVAERTAAVGAAIAAGVAGLDPTVAGIIGGGARHDAVAVWNDLDRLARLRRQADTTWRVADALLLPTAPEHPTRAAVAADPVGVNSRLGRFTNFANLLDLCAAAVPSGTSPAGTPVGVTVFAPAWRDRRVARLGQIITGEDAALTQLDPPGIPVAVFGAHLRGQPLHHQLTDLGARWAEAITTAPCYRLHALATTPAKPGLVRVAAGGAAIAGELYHLDAGAFGRFVAAVPPPMTIQQVELADGRRVSGFGCEPGALAGATDITAWGGWRAWLGRDAR